MNVLKRRDSITCSSLIPFCINESSFCINASRPSTTRNFFQIKAPTTVRNMPIETAANIVMVRSPMAPILPWPRWLIHLTHRPAMLRNLSRPKVQVSGADCLSHSTPVIATPSAWRSPPFCSFRPHPGVVTSGQTFAICSHADGRRPGDLTDIRSHPRPTEGPAALLGLRDAGRGGQGQRVQYFGQVDDRRERMAALLRDMSCRSPRTVNRLLTMP